jgi:hypothetical protein
MSLSLQTAIIFLKSVNQLIYVMEKRCFLSSTDWILKYYLDQNVMSFRLLSTKRQYQNMHQWFTMGVKLGVLR